jgi:hypothetical protein
MGRNGDAVLLGPCSDDRQPVEVAFGEGADVYLALEMAFASSALDMWE